MAEGYVFNQLFLCSGLRYRIETLIMFDHPTYSHFGRFSHLKELILYFYF